MAVDASQVAPEATESTGSSSEAPRAANSSSRPGWLKNFFGGVSESPSGQNLEAALTATSGEAKQSAESSAPEVKAEPAATRTPRHTFETDEDLRRYEQSVADRAIHRYREESQKEERQRTLQRYDERIEKAHADGDLMLAGELAVEKRQYEKGALIEQHTAESLRAAQEEAYQQATAQTAATLDQAYTRAIHQALPDPLKKEFGSWWDKEMAPRADGSHPHDPQQAREKIVDQLLKLHGEHFRQLGRDDVLTEIDTDPTLRKAVIAHLRGSSEEAPSVKGETISAPTYRTRREVIDAVGSGTLTPKQAQPLLKKLQAAGTAR